MWYVRIQGGKIKAIKVSGIVCPIKLFQFFKDFRSIVDNPKTIDTCVPGDAFAVLFEMIFRLEVSNWDSGLVVQVLEAAMNLQ